MLKFKLREFNPKLNLTTYDVFKYNLLILIIDIINLGYNKKKIEKFGEQYICTINAKDLDDAKRIYHKYLG